MPVPGFRSRINSAVPLRLAWARIGRPFGPKGRAGPRVRPERARYRSARTRLAPLRGAELYWSRCLVSGAE